VIHNFPIEQLRQLLWRDKKENKLRVVFFILVSCSVKGFSEGSNAYVKPYVHTQFCGSILYGWKLRNLQLPLWQFCRCKGDLQIAYGGTNSRINIGKTDMKAITDGRYWRGYMVRHILVYGASHTGIWCVTYSYSHRKGTCLLFRPSWQCLLYVPYHHIPYIWQWLLYVPYRHISHLHCRNFISVYEYKAINTITTLGG
jgi:hypothetical protein